MAERLKLRGGIYHYWRRRPAMFADVEPRPFILISLETRDLKRARKLRDFHDRKLEELWVALKRGESEDARERYLAAIERARLEGFEYRPAADVSQGDLGDILSRLRRLEELYPQAADSNAPSPTRGEVAAADAILGTAIRPELTLSKAFEEFHKLKKPELRKKSADQLRRWKAPRIKAVRNLAAVAGIGDKPLSRLTRADANAFRAWWVDRVVDEGYTSNSANKDLGHLAQIVDTLSDALKLGLDRPFAALRIPDETPGKREAFSNDELLAIVADPRHLAELNPEARGVLLAMVETGLRPIEICNLGEKSIVLEHAVPHVSIEPDDNRELKTRYSHRVIPLVGISLAAFQMHRKGFPRYFDRSSQLSAAVNPYLKRRGLLPSDNHSLYSIRHNFKDRLRAVDMSEEMIDRLMGHKNPKPDYGKGWTLEHQREWLLKAALTPTPKADRAQMALFSEAR